MKGIGLILLVFIIGNCNSGSNYEFWDLDQFHLRDNVLVDWEEVRLIYASRAPDYKNDDYYVHFIVISKTTSDTVNVLSSVNQVIKDSRKGVGYIFNSNNTELSKMTESIINREEIDSVLYKKNIAYP